MPELDANPNDPGINFARNTQTTISPALFNLPAEAIAGRPDKASPVCNGSADLLSRDFARGTHDDLASGQDIARALGCHVIPASSIKPTHDAALKTGTPLLYYVFAETQRSGQTLGCSGRSIVAQVFLRVLWDTPNSILHTGFHPDPNLVKLAPETPNSALVISLWTRDWRRQAASGKALGMPTRAGASNSATARVMTRPRWPPAATRFAARALGWITRQSRRISVRVTQDGPLRTI